MKKTSSIKIKEKLAFAILLITLFIPQMMFAQKLDWVELANSKGGFGFYPLQPQICVDGNDNSYVIGLNALKLNFGQNLNSDSGSNFIARYDKNGRIKWVINAKGNCTFQSITANGYNILVEGMSNLKSSFNGTAIGAGVSFIMKIDSTGKVKWLKEYDSVQLTAISEGADGITYFSGTFNNIYGVSNV